MDEYRALEERHAQMAHLSCAAAVLHWDRATVMPVGGAGARAEQLATLSTLIHELRIDPVLGDLLDTASAREGELDDWQRANLREMRIRRRHAIALPARLVDALSRCASETEMTWRAARAEDDWTLLAPGLDRLVKLVCEAAAAKGEAFGCEPYEALLDEYDPGRSVAEVDELFSDLELFLPDFTREVLERQAAEPAPLMLSGTFPAARQRELGERFMRILGFDFEHGRLDVSHHPFTGGVPDDVRITTRYDEEDFASGWMAVLHETGHAQYERGLPSTWRSQPVGESRGMTIHESQSLLFEMQLGRSREFLGFAAPLLREVFGTAGEAWELPNLLKSQHRVERGLIRVEADEVTYPLHVILRYQLERALISGELQVADLPGAWRENMRRLLGVEPVGDADGCMQDIHWPSGAFGYFPTYTLGAVAAAQIFDAVRRDEPDLLSEIERGELETLLVWLKRNVHGLGCRYSPSKLIERATGRPLASEAFKMHLTQRYLGAG